MLGTALLMEKLSRDIAISLLSQVIVHLSSHSLIDSQLLRVRLGEDLLSAALDFDAALVTTNQVMGLAGLRLPFLLFAVAGLESLGCRDGKRVKSLLLR